MKNLFAREHSLYALVPYSRWYEHFAISKQKNEFLEVILNFKSYVLKNKAYNHDLICDGQIEGSCFDRVNKFIINNAGSNASKSLPAGSIKVNSKSAEEEMRVYDQAFIHKHACISVSWDQYNPLCRFKNSIYHKTRSNLLPLRRVWIFTNNYRSNNCTCTTTFIANIRLCRWETILLAFTIVFNIMNFRFKFIEGL